MTKFTSFISPGWIFKARSERNYCRIKTLLNSSVTFFSYWLLKAERHSWMLSRLGLEVELWRLSGVKVICWHPFLEKLSGKLSNPSTQISISSYYKFFQAHVAFSNWLYQICFLFQMYCWHRRCQHILSVQIVIFFFWKKLKWEDYIENHL